MIIIKYRNSVVLGVFENIGAITNSAMLTTGLDQNTAFHYSNSLSTQKHSLVLLIEMNIENSPSG